jgi:hypothetical protein
MFSLLARRTFSAHEVDDARRTRPLATSLEPEEEMTTIATTIKPRVTFGERLRRIGMAMYGPADMGPYGPSVPPTPRLRDHRGRLIKPPNR